MMVRTGNSASGFVNQLMFDYRRIGNVFGNMRADVAMFANALEFSRLQDFKSNLIVMKSGMN